MTALVHEGAVDSYKSSINSALTCKMNSQCFDWSRCPISSGFPVYFYKNDMDNENSWVVSVGIKSGYRTRNPEEACLFVVSGRHNFLSKDLMARVH